ncbi:MAG: hypothetical protein IJ298_04060 [Ruminococcus sp.]|nr:hypothetical protein [Ruminococcus sp.]
MESMTNSKYFKVETVEQFKILKYININFKDNALELELLQDNAIKATDKNGEQVIFYYDYEAQKVSSQDNL